MGIARIEHYVETAWTMQLHPPLPFNCFGGNEDVQVGLASWA